MKEERSVFRTVWSVFTVDTEYKIVVGPVHSRDTDAEAWAVVNSVVDGDADKSKPQYVCFMQSVAYTDKAGVKKITFVVRQIVEDKL